MKPFLVGRGFVNVTTQLAAFKILHVSLGNCLFLIRDDQTSQWERAYVR